jgi:hypothetical protein
VRDREGPGSRDSRRYDDRERDRYPRDRYDDVSRHPRHIKLSTNAKR